MASTRSLVLLLLGMMMFSIVVYGRHDMGPTRFRFKPILDPEEDWPNN